jgi:hypothetical protein
MFKKIKDVASIGAIKRIISVEGGFLYSEV